MRITVFGLGYVGCVTAACLASHHHDVVGVDVDETKVRLINEGRSPIVEPGLEELIQAGIQEGRLRATADVRYLGEVALVCVGTPSNENGSLGMDQLLRVLDQIGELLRSAPDHGVVAIRSTVLPGTIEEFVIPRLQERSGKTCGPDFSVCMNPEFVRETTAVRDFGDPPFTVVGAQDSLAVEAMARVYEQVPAPFEHTSIREAEMIKYVCNAFHAVKVCFANEVGNFCKRMKLDSHRVMDIVCLDTKLNLSRYYMKPGFAFGGSCLPKDLRALLYKSRQLDLEMPMVASLLESNRRQVDRALAMIRQTGKKSVGMLGLSFKAGTDDLRESPTVELTEALIGKGYLVKVYDEEVSLTKLHGANRRYIELAIPHISSLMADSLGEVVEHGDVLVIAKKNAAFADAIRAVSADRTVIDLVRLFGDETLTGPNYHGICW